MILFHLFLLHEVISCTLLPRVLLCLMPSGGATQAAEAARKFESNPAALAEAKPDGARGRTHHVWAWLVATDDDRSKLLEKRGP